MYVYNFSAGTHPNDVQSSLSSDGVLTVTAPRKPAVAANTERVVPITQTGPAPKQEQESTPSTPAASTESSASTPQVE